MICPKCGAPMQERIARAGSYAGRKFWGCSNYPRCKEIVNIAGNDPELKMDGASSEDQRVNGTMHIENDELLFLYAEPCRKGFESFFFQSLALPSEVFVLFNNGILSVDEMEAYSRFRIDIKEASNDISFENKGICSLILRLLNRGFYTLNSPNIEKCLKEMFEPENMELRNLSILDRFVKYNNVVMPCDSERELELIKYLQPLLGDNFYSHIISQVYVNSIIAENNPESIGQRVDYLLSVEQGDFVIEIDGSEHQSHITKDNTRDENLKSAGYKVVRIKNSELDNDNSPNLNELKELCSKQKVNYKTSFDGKEKLLIASKLVHQLQIAIVKALEAGAISACEKINVNICTDALSTDEVNKLSKVALDDLADLFDHFCDLYTVNQFFACELTKINSVDCFTVSFGNDVSKINSLIIRDVFFHKHLACDIDLIDSIYPSCVNCVNKDILEYFLNYIFHFDGFQEGQLEAIERLILKKDTIVLLPTGSGKSLIYQLSSLIVPGMTVVVAPLTSLMLDQITNLEGKGITNSVAIHSSLNRDNVSKASKMMKYKHITMVYISPERLQMKGFRGEIESVLINNSVFTVAVDEAHCVSEWGHDFRTSYLNIGRNARNVFKKKGMAPVIVALTGTASTAVLKDVKRELDILDYDAIITPTTFDRSELHFFIVQASSEKKTAIASEFIKNEIPRFFNKSKRRFFSLKDDDTACGIIFCPHVNGDFGIVKFKNKLSEEVPTSIGIYSGKPPKGKDKKTWESEKQDEANKFKHNQKNILVATKAFGMGIDKPNIRYTVHYGIPGSIESFYQEVGRAGRDRKDSYCTIIFSNDNDLINRKLLDVNTSLEEVIDYMSKITIDMQDDISRMLFFHVNAFKGIENELTYVKRVLEHIFINENLDSNKSTYTIAIKDKKECPDIEKAIQRLIVLGVVGDLTIDYASNEYSMKLGSAKPQDITNSYCRYVSGYNEGRVITEKRKIESLKSENILLFIRGASKVLIEFIYDTVEKGRRRGLHEITQMSIAALSTKYPDVEIRNRVVRYFESTYAEEINAIIEDNNLGFHYIVSIFDGTVNELGEQIGGIRSYNEAFGIRGQASRYLESTPDHPGLLFLRALSELYSKDYDKETVIEDYNAAIKFARERYSCNEKKLLNFMIFFLNKTFERDFDLYQKLFKISIADSDSEEFCSIFIESESLSDSFKALPASIYFNINTNKVLEKIKDIKGE